MSAPSCYILSVNLTSLGIYKNIKDSDFDVHLFGDVGCLLNSFKKNINFYPLSVEKSPELVLKKILEIGSIKNGPNFIFTSSDLDIFFIEKYREDLEKFAILSLPDKKVTNMVNDKVSFATKIMKSGIRTPRTLCVDKNNYKEVCKQFIFPCIFKPVNSRDWKKKEISTKILGKKAFIVKNNEEFINTAKWLFTFTSKLLAQEIVDVSDDGNYSFCCYANHDGNVIFGFVTQKILQYPEKFGTALLCKTVNRPDIANFGANIVNKLVISGVSESEIVIDKNTGELNAIEVNTRHWMQHRLSTRLGVNYSLLDFYYRTGNESKVRELVANCDGRHKNVIWFDDVGYLIYVLKNFLHPKKCKLGEVLKNHWEFSLVSFSDLRSFFKCVWQKVINNR